MVTDNSNATNVLWTGQKIAVHLGNKEPTQREKAPNAHVSKLYNLLTLLYNSGRTQPNYGAQVLKSQKKSWLYLIYSCNNLTTNHELHAWISSKQFFGLKLCFKCSNQVYLLKFNWFEQNKIQFVYRKLNLRGAL